MHRVKTVRRVYSENEDSKEVQYIEGIDFVIDYKRRTIRRTDDSSIPNYSEHYVAYESGKFTVIDDSEKNNPENNRKYQIKVDYDYYVNEKELEVINNNSACLGENVRNKILNREDITIALCGDSIGAGVGTNGRDIFLNYLDETLEQYYGLRVKTMNLSIGERGRDILATNLRGIIEMEPDIMMIEFGMDDHCGTDGNADEQMAVYINDIENAIKSFKENNIDVILVGFFQQNMTRDVENMEVTRLYNEALNDLADNNNIFFADVYSTFEKVGNIKHIRRDVMADFINHPNEWGHKLYLTSMIDAFDIIGEMRPIDLTYYVFVE